MRKFPDLQKIHCFKTWGGVGLLDLGKGKEVTMLLKRRVGISGVQVGHQGLLGREIIWGISAPGTARNQALTGVQGQIGGQWILVHQQVLLHPGTSLSSNTSTACHTTAPSRVPPTQPQQLGSLGLGYSRGLAGVISIMVRCLGTLKMLTMARGSVTREISL